MVGHKRFSSVHIHLRLKKEKKLQIIIRNTGKQFLLFYEAASSVQMISCHTLLESDVIDQRRGRRQIGGGEIGRVPARRWLRTSEWADEFSAGAFV